MDLDLLLLHVYCLVDDALRRLGLNQPRSRGPEPTLDDAEVITIEIVGEFLELHDDTKLFWFFRRYHSRDFPNLQSVTRSTFVRQAANLWKVKQELQRHLAHQLVPDDVSWLVDSLPIRACRFGRAKFCQRFRGQAAYGYDHGDRHTFYGFRLHVRCDRLSGVVLAYQLAPANAADKAVLRELDLPPDSMGLGDRAYWDPELAAELRQLNIRFYAPFNTRKHDPNPRQSRLLSSLRYFVETVQGQLAERYRMKQTKTRKLWHFQHRIIRKILSHTVAVWLCRQAGIPSLRLAELMAA
jgi:Transposase DDE domain